MPIKCQIPIRSKIQSPKFTRGFNWLKHQEIAGLLQTGTLPHLMWSKSTKKERKDRLTERLWFLNLWSWKSVNQLWAARLWLVEPLLGKIYGGCTKQGWASLSGPHMIPYPVPQDLYLWYGSEETCQICKSQTRMVCLVTWRWVEWPWPPVDVPKTDPHYLLVDSVDIANSCHQKA